MTNESIVDFKNVSFSYSKDVPVLTNVNFEIKKGEATCIIGPNGGGKTTLLGLILGLIKPINGNITILGKKPEAARMKIGYTPQHTQFDAEFPISVMDIVLMGRVNLHLLGPYSKKDRIAALSTLDRLNCSNLSKRLFSSLSGGQRQKVLIARALVSDPELLLLDEATANMDPSAQESFNLILTELNKTITTIVVSHDLGFVTNKFKYVLCVNRKVHIHPTTDITGDIIRRIYGGDISIVHHDKCCAHKNGGANND